MAQDLTIEAQFKAQSLEKEPNIILTIDGFDDIWGAVNVEKLARYGQDGIFYGQPGLVYGGAIQDSRSRDYVSLDGTTTRISQQLEVDKGGTGSIQSFNVKLLDPKGEISKKFSPGFEVADILARDAKVSFLFQGTPYPESAVTLFIGIISEITFPPGACVIRVAHPDQLKRQEIFTEIDDELNGSINSSVTTITLNSTVNMVEPATDFRTYIVVEEEIVEYTGISGNQLTGCVRGSLNTIAASHSDEAATKTMYSLHGNGIEIALKLMLSNPRLPIYFSSTNDTLLDPVIVGPLETPPLLRFRGVEFKGVNLIEDQGASVGDTVDIYTGTKGDPNTYVFFGTRTITEIIISNTGTEVYFNLRIPILAVFFEFINRYNVWPIGLNMKPNQVDIERFERVDSLYSATFPEMSLYMKTGMTGIDIIQQDLMLPNALYSIPRRGRSSIGLMLPPIAETNVQVLDEKNITNPSELRISRSINESFYNKVVYAFDEDSLEDDLLGGIITIDEDSVNRINFENKPFKVTARGFRKGDGTEAIIRRQSERVLDRYRFAAEKIEGVKVLLGTGFNIDVSDTVIFGSPALQITDVNRGDRSFAPRVMEVVNKTFDVKGRITIDLLDTSFSTNGRYGIVGPSSYASSYADGLLVLKRSFTSIAGEQNKWVDYVSENIQVRDANFNFVSIVRLIGVSSGNPNALVISAPDITVNADYIVELAPYDSAGSISKAVHPYFTPQVNITAITSQTEIEVDRPEVFFEGSTIEIHSAGYADISRDVTVLSIDGSVITLDRAPSFTVGIGDFIELVGFVSDEGLPYRIL
jgi:hypothetical protein